MYCTCVSTPSFCLSRSPRLSPYPSLSLPLSLSLSIPLSSSLFLVTFVNYVRGAEDDRGEKKSLATRATGPSLNPLARWFLARVSSLTPQGTLNASPELPWRHPSSLSGPSILSSSPPRRRSPSSSTTGLPPPLRPTPGFPYNLPGSRVALFFLPYSIFVSPLYPATLRRCHPSPPRPLPPLLSSSTSFVLGDVFLVLSVSVSATATATVTAFYLCPPVRTSSSWCQP